MKFSVDLTSSARHERCTRLSEIYAAPHLLAMSASSASRDTWQYAFPTRYKALMSIHRTLFGITFIWLLFIVYVVLSVVGYPEQTAQFPARTLLIAVVVLITTICYTRTFFKFGSNVAAASGHVSIAAQQRIKKEKRIAWTMLLTVGILALCYFPEMIAYPIITRKPEKLSLIWIGLNRTPTIMFVNSLINPFWYCCKFQEIRRDVLSLLGCARNVSPWKRWQRSR